MAICANVRTTFAYDNLKIVIIFNDFMTWGVWTFYMRIIKDLIIILLFLYIVGYIIYTLVIFLYLTLMIF